MGDVPVREIRVLKHGTIELWEIHKINLPWISGKFYKYMLNGKPRSNNCFIFDYEDWNEVRKAAKGKPTEYRDDMISELRIEMDQNIVDYIDINIDRSPFHVFTVCSSYTKRIIGFVVVGPIGHEKMSPQLEVTLWKDKGGDYSVRQAKKDIRVAIQNQYNPKKLTYRKMKKKEV